MYSEYINVHVLCIGTDTAVTQQNKNTSILSGSGLTSRLKVIVMANV
jgi:hypothetical protein